MEYIERLYAGGRIKGSRWVKREGRPTDEATLTARLIDRSVRPLFPEGYRNEIQVIITVLSVDSENSADIPAVGAVSAALAISDIPWEGPVGGVRVGFVPKNGEGVFIINPTYQDLEFSELDLVISSTEKAVIMLEGGAKEISEETLLKAIESGQKESLKIIKTINELAKEVGKKKEKFTPVEIKASLINQIEKEAKKEVEEAVGLMASKEGPGGVLEEIKQVMAEKYPEEKKDQISKIIEKLFKKTMRNQILTKGKRPDGRKPTEIRPIEIEVGVLPRTHGSAMFKRGNTQALTVTTLGSPSLKQWLENMEGDEPNRYIH
ncbi:polyribonucleotide nucleotidyltransferase, partial [Patescibacteria group bacterium]|nr:polyribonucleotide nucleotidyltransferase [Patescibacteria group bacterium]